MSTNSTTANSVTSPTTVSPSEGHENHTTTDFLTSPTTMSSSEGDENSATINSITPPTTISPSESGENSTTSIPRSIIEIQRIIIEKYKESGATISDEGSQDPEKCFKVLESEVKGQFVAELDSEHIILSPGRSCCAQCTGGGDSREEALENLLSLLEKVEYDHKEGHPIGYTRA